MKHLNVIILTLFLGACGITPEGQAVRLAVKEYGAIAADAELDNLEWALCNGVTVGAIRRKYQPGSEKRSAWDALCK